MSFPVLKVAIHKGVIFMSFVWLPSHQIFLYAPTLIFGSASLVQLLDYSGSMFATDPSTYPRACHKLWCTDNHTKISPSPWNRGIVEAIYCWWYLLLYNICVKCKVSAQWCSHAHLPESQRESTPELGQYSMHACQCESTTEPWAWLPKFTHPLNWSSVCVSGYVLGLNQAGVGKV